MPHKPTMPPQDAASALDPTLDDADLFSLPTRTSIRLPRRLLLDAGASRTNWWRRRPVLWAAGAVLASLTSVGIVSATGDGETQARPQPAAAPPRESTLVVRRAESGPVVGEGPCRITVVAVPANASVELDGTPQGTAPLTLATTCGTHRIDVSHPTHATLTVWGMLTDGQPETVDVSLARRIDSVAVVTKPAGAMLYIDGHPVGRTPKRLDVLGHVPLTFEIRKPGFRTVVEHVYSTTPRNNVSVALTPVVRPPGVVQVTARR